MDKLNKWNIILKFFYGIRANFSSGRDIGFELS